MVGQWGHRMAGQPDGEVVGCEMCGSEMPVSKMVRLPDSKMAGW